MQPMAHIAMVAHNASSGCVCVCVLCVYVCVCVYYGYDHTSRGNTGSKPPPIKAFIDELQSPESSGRLDQLKRKLDPQHKGLSLGYKFLEKGTVVMVYSKDAPEEQRIVVKFNPLGRRDPIIDDVRYVCWCV